MNLLWHLLHTVGLDVAKQLGGQCNPQVRRALFSALPADMNPELPKDVSEEQKRENNKKLKGEKLMRLEPLMNATQKYIFKDRNFKQTLMLGFPGSFFCGLRSSTVASFAKYARRTSSGSATLISSPQPGMLGGFASLRGGRRLSIRRSRRS